METWKHTRIWRYVPAWYDICRIERCLFDLGKEVLRVLIQCDLSDFDHLGALRVGNDFSSIEDVVITITLLGWVDDLRINIPGRLVHRVDFII